MTSDGPIDWRQYRLLVRTFLRISARGRSRKSPYGRIVSLFASYGISAAYLGWTLGKFYFEPAYVMISCVVTMHLAGFAVLSSYPVILLDPLEDTILSQFPLSSRTVLYARATNMFAYVALLGIPFAVPLAGFYLAYSGSIPSFFAFVFVLFLCTLWVTALFILLYNLIIAAFGHSSQLVSFAQIVLVFLLLFFYQALPGIAQHSVDWSFLFAPTSSFLLPPLWFVALHGTITGAEFQAYQPIYAALALATTVFLLLFLGSRWMLLPEKGRPSADAQPATPPGERLRHILSAVRLDGYDAAHRAGFDLFQRMFVRERTFRLQVLPVIMMPVAVSIYGLIAGDMHSPFPAGILDPRAKMHIPILVFSLFSARHVAKVVERAVAPPTVWILRQNTSGSLERFAHGVRAATFVRIVIPQMLLLLALFLAAMPARDALLQTAFILAFVRLQNATLSAFRPRVPFAQEEERLATTQRFAQFFVIMPFFIAALVVHVFFAPSIPAFLIATIFCFALAQTIGSVRRVRRYAFTGT